MVVNVLADDKDESESAESILAPVFAWWKLVHVPTATVLGVLALIHVLLQELGPLLS